MTDQTAPGVKRYFITYAHIDLWQARQIADVLKGNGDEVSFGERLTTPDWKAALTALITPCDALIYLLSPESARSEWCLWEMAQAAAQGKLVSAVLLQPEVVLPDALKPLVPIDLTPGITPEGIDRLLKGVKQPTAPDTTALPLIDELAGKPSRAESDTKHVFLSYSRRDLALMQRTRDALRAANVAVWTDESIAVGAPLWKDAIEKAIENAGCLLVILSPDAKQSIWVKRELDYAAAHSVPITPVLGRGTDAESVPFSLAGSQYVDLSTSFENNIGKAINAVKTQMGGKPEAMTAQPHPTPPASAPAKPKLDSAFWDILFRLIRREKCTLFLGPAISAKALTPQPQMARIWAELRKYPFEAYEGDLARVAQFLAFELGDFVAKDEIIEKWLKRGTPPDFNDASNGYAVLSSLPLPLYITTNYDDYLCAALTYKGKTPQRVFFYDGEWIGGKTNIAPSADQPMVIHLYGHQKETESLVISEDDYLRFLLKFARQEVTFPDYVTDRLGRTSYVFIGFTASDWSLRTLFQIISTLGRKGTEPHIAVQVEPIRTVDSHTQTERVEEYLRNYFRSHLSATNVQVSVEETHVFLSELGIKWANWQKEQAANG